MLLDEVSKIPLADRQRESRHQRHLWFCNPQNEICLWESENETYGAGTGNGFGRGERVC